MAEDQARLYGHDELRAFVNVVARMHSTGNTSLYLPGLLEDDSLNNHPRFGGMPKILLPRKISMALPCIWYI